MERRGRFFRTSETVLSEAWDLVVQITKILNDPDLGQDRFEQPTHQNRQQIVDTLRSIVYTLGQNASHKDEDEHATTQDSAEILEGFVIHVRDSINREDETMRDHLSELSGEVFAELEN